MSVTRTEYNLALKVFTELKCSFAIKLTDWIAPVTSRQVEPELVGPS